MTGEGFIPHSRPWVSRGDEEKVVAQLRSGQLAVGEMVTSFSNDLCAACDLKKVFLTVSGTASIYLALKALKVGAGDEVILPTYVCESVLNSVQASGATPVLCDVGPLWNMVPETVDQCFSTRTKAIILVNIFGILAPIEPFRRFKVPIVNDLCQALDGALSDKSHVDRGDFVTLSFSATKCLTTGRGGAVAAATPHFEDALASAHMAHCQFFNMTDMQAALGISQLGRYEEFQGKRQQLVDNYLREIPSAATQRFREVQRRSMLFRMPLSNAGPDFQSTADRFMERRVIVRRGVDALLHRSLGLTDEGFENSVRAFEETLSIPLYPSLDGNQAAVVARACREIL